MPTQATSICCLPLPSNYPLIQSPTRTVQIKSMRKMASRTDTLTRTMVRYHRSDSTLNGARRGPLRPPPHPRNQVKGKRTGLRGKHQPIEI